MLLPESSAVSHPAFDPDLIYIPVAPQGEQADAVPGRHDLFEVMLQLLYRQVLIYILPYLVGG